MKQKKAKRTYTGKPQGKSKYAKKIEWRKRRCRELGISDVPIPVLGITYPGG